MYTWGHYASTDMSSLFSLEAILGFLEDMGISGGNTRGFLLSQPVPGSPGLGGLALRYAAKVRTWNHGNGWVFVATEG